MIFGLKIAAKFLNTFKNGVTVKCDIIKMFEKNQASEVMPDRNGHKILTAEFHFRGKYLKFVRSGNI